MNEQETIRFILENSSEPVIKNPVMRAALQEPRTMAQEPRNMAQGGRIIGKPGGLVEPGIEYYGKKVVSHEESLKRRTAIKNYIKNKGKVIDGYEFKEFLSNLGYKKPRDIVKGLEEGGMFTEDILGKKTITKTERPPRTGINLSKSQITTLNKYASLLNKQEPKKYTSSVFTELGDLERANILNRARLNDWEFKATTKWDPLTPKQQQNIIETFDLPEDAFKKMEGIQKNVKDISGKYGVPRYLESGKKNPLYDKIQRYAKNGFKFSPKDMLPIAKQREIIARFELPGEFEKWNFEKYKYGIPSGGSASNPAFTKRIIDYAQGKTRFPNLATDAGTPQGWMMNNYYRTYEYEKGKVPRDKLTYKPIFETINGRQKVVGFVDNTMPGKGNTYFGIKKWHNKHGGNLMTTHPDFKNVKKFVDISKRAYAEPNKVIMGLLKKGGIESTGKLQLKHVLNYLAETQGYKATEDAVRIHHQAGVGAGGVPGEATRDLQLLKSEVNSSIRHAETRIRNAVVNNLTPNIDDVNKLKNLGASIKVGGKIYGGGSQTAIGQFKAIEKGAETSIRNWNKKDFTEFNKYLRSFCGYGRSDGGRIGFQAGSCPDGGKSGFLKATDDVAKGRVTGEAAEQIAKNAGKVVAKAGSKSALASIFGPAGIGIDIAYEVGSVGIDMYAGKPWKEAVQDNWIAGAFMPGTGQEEFHKRLFEEYPVGYEGEKTKKYPEAKPYGSGLDLKEAYDKKLETIERMKANTTWRGRAEAERQLPGLERDLRGIAAQYNALGSIMEEGSPEYENYMAAVTEARDADKAKSKATKAKLKMELDRPTSDRAVPYKRGEPVKIDFKLPKPVEISKTPLNADQLQEYAEYHRNVGDLEPRGELPQWYVDEIQNKEKWRQLFEQRGIRGSQDWKGATGGIMNLKKKW